MNDKRIARGALICGAALLWAATAAAGPGLDEKCQALKNSEAGKLAACLENAEMKLLMTAGHCSVTTDTVCYRDGDCPSGQTCQKDPTKYDAAIAKCNGKFAAKWQAFEDAFGVCPTTGDRANVQDVVEGCRDTIKSLLDTTCENLTGAAVGGACWFLADQGMSCDTMCALPGLAYDVATRDYAGSGGTDEHCAAVLDAVGVGGTGATAVSTGAGAGCFWLPGGPADRFRDTDPTVSNFGVAGTYRACACK